VKPPWYYDRYTYGKPVKGTVTLRAKLDNWYRPYNYHGGEPMEQTMDASYTFIHRVISIWTREILKYILYLVAARTEI